MNPIRGPRRSTHPHRWTTAYALFCILGTVLFVASCSRVAKEELYGEYRAEYPFGTQRLILRSDRTYTQIIRIKAPTDSVLHSGTWEYWAEFGDVALVNGLHVQDGWGGLAGGYQTPIDGYVLHGVHRFFPWNSIRLGSDELIQLVKLNTQSGE